MREPRRVNPGRTGIFFLKRTKQPFVLRSRPSFGRRLEARARRGSIGGQGRLTPSAVSPIASAYMAASRSHAVHFDRRALVLAAASFAAFLAAAAIGARQAVDEQRVFGVLDPAFQPLIHSGKDILRWPLSHADGIAQAVTAAASAIAVVALLRHRRRGVPIVLLAGAGALATWGQVWLLRDRIGAGTWCYAGGIVCAFLLGLWCPLSKLPGFPQLPTAPDDVLPPAAGGPSARTANCRMMLQILFQILIEMTSILISGL